MSLTTYSGLKDSIASWLKRTDLTTNIPDFIELAEARIARDLRLRKQITQATLTTTAGVQTVALPADWLEFENVNILTSPPRNLTYVNIEHMDVRFPSDFTGTPAVYTMEGEHMLFGPVPDAAYSVDVFYYARLAALSDSNATNWLLTNHPSIYLFAALAEAEPFMHNDQRAGMWEAKYAKEVNDLQSSDDAGMFSGSALRVRSIQ